MSYSVDFECRIGTYCCLLLRYSRLVCLQIECSLNMTSVRAYVCVRMLVYVLECMRVCTLVYTTATVHVSIISRCCYCCCRNPQLTESSLCTHLCISYIQTQAHTHTHTRRVYFPFYSCYAFSDEFVCYKKQPTTTTLRNKTFHRPRPALCFIQYLLVVRNCSLNQTCVFVYVEIIIHK